MTHHDIGIPVEQNFEVLDGFALTSIYSVITEVRSKIRCSFYCMEQTTPRCVSFHYVDESMLCEISLYAAVYTASVSSSQVHQITGMLS